MNIGIQLSHFIKLYAMNYSFDLWDMSAEEHSFNIFYDLPSPLQHSQYPQFLPINPENRILIEDPHKFGSLQLQTEPETTKLGKPKAKKSNGGKNRGNNRGNGQQKWKRKRKIKPSPYHNYQKHLNTTLRHLLSFPTPSDCSTPAAILAHRLWGIFVDSQSSTKKILHLVFNEYNEHRLKEEELRDFGFYEVYQEYGADELGEARTLLTQMAVGQMKEENIDAYLATRRIKNPIKFKRYLMVFRRQLQEGFLKKRFTNRSRKEQMRRQMLLTHS